tara:strand:+ start:13830 stop:15227 length:1398 start_codon:yes stop_codon:yes gene_type:complete
MTLKIFNTLTRKKEIFKPIKKGNVGFYTCGPTVYDYAHIGNFRAYMCSDILKRYLRYQGHKVNHVMNITDVDDKTIKGSQKKDLSLKEFTKEYTKFFLEDLKSLNIDTPDVFPKATEHIPEMVDIIEKLLKNKVAYKGDDDSIYFSIDKFKDYGKLSNEPLKNLKSGVRISHDQYDKDQVNDFALWKSYSEEDKDVSWKTNIGKGRPGWHIECSAMAMKHLGPHFDIHAGGIDLVFPHHENEIAQSEASTNKKFANYWFHNEHLLVDGKKMSKSLGNFFTLRDLINKDHKPLAIRYLLLSSNYRQQLNFTEEGIKAAQNSIERLNDFIKKVRSIKNTKGKNITSLINKTKKDFEDSMNDDINISSALSNIFDFVREINSLMDSNKVSKQSSKEILDLMKEFDSILDVMNFKNERLDSEIKQLVEERELARKNKDFAKADKIRDHLLKQGIALEDTPEGISWKNIK